MGICFFRSRPGGLNGVSGTGKQPGKARATAITIVLLMAAGVGAWAQDTALAVARDGRAGVALSQHVPAWASVANQTGVVASGTRMSGMTLVLARSAEKEQAFEEFLVEQQDPNSSEYHHWLTPAELGQRFGASKEEIATLTAWLKSEGLTVNHVASSRGFISFSGTASTVNQAFQTELRTYKVGVETRYAIAAAPVMPAQVAGLVKAIRGLASHPERPLSKSTVHQAAAPNLTLSSSAHYLTPGDFSTIYNVPTSAQTGAGYTIGIVAESRTNMADFTYFKQWTGATFANPTEVIPTAFGGVDPGAAYTTTTSADLGAQGEAELDVMRAGSVANGAKLLVVAATAGSGGIYTAAQYMIDTTPVPVHVIDISWGACELAGGQSGVAAWDALFKLAAAEGITVLVSSGDSAAAGCDAAFSLPPSTQIPVSPNYICSSSYATCVGGTEFADTANPAKYWGSNGTGYASALSYIPEGAWNEPTSGSYAVVVGTGGGVSSYVATPSWQTGTGVPSARAGRYTPDISFSSACHDGYFACMAASGASCVPNSAGQFSFTAFCGTSAAAPDMAGITALLDQKLGKAQGNLNPQLYALATSTPAVFHDTTVSSSGVASCSLATPSMCNNSIYANSAATQTEQGYLVTAGFDEATGLGSLDVTQLLNNYAAGTLTPPTLSSPAAGATLTAGTTSATLQWAAVTGATSYSVLAGTSCGAGTAATVSSTSYSLTGLASGTTYYWQVRAASSSATSAYSACRSFSVATPVTATPVFSLASGTYTAAQTLAITDATANATIYYTVNGATPTTASTKYTGAITIATSETVKAMAVASGYSSSATASASYVFNAPTPTITPAAGTYGAAQLVTLTATSSVASSLAIYYTVDGSTPTTSSTKYSAPFVLAASGTVKAIAAATGVTTSGATQATYSIYGAPWTLAAPATAITSSGATLNAVVSANGLAATYQFRYGSSATSMTKLATILKYAPAVGTTTGSLAANAANLAVNAALTGLTTKTTYYYQVTVTTAGGTTSGAILNFTTN